LTLSIPSTINKVFPFVALILIYLLCLFMFVYACVYLLLYVCFVYLCLFMFVYVCLCLFMIVYVSLYLFVRFMFVYLCLFTQTGNSLIISSSVVGIVKTNPCCCVNSRMIRASTWARELLYSFMFVFVHSCLLVDSFMFVGLLLIHVRFNLFHSCFLFIHVGFHNSCLFLFILVFLKIPC